MQQGGVERGERPDVGESLLEDPYAIVERIRGLETEGLEKFARIALSPAFTELTDEKEATLLRLKEEIKQRARANLVQWLSDGWRGVDQKISAVPLGEETQVPDFYGAGTYSLAERELKLSETTSIKEKFLNGTRVVTLHHEPNDQQLIDIDFIVYGSGLRRVGFKTRGGEIDGFIQLVDRQVRARWQEVSGFSFELPVAQPAEAVS